MNCLSIYLKYAPIFAIFLNFIGAILLLFCTGAYTDGGVLFQSVGKNGKPLETIYLLKPTRFKIGIGLIVAGFLIQIINELFKLGWLKSS